MSTAEEKLPEKCCMRHEIKKGVHWIAAWNHCFTFLNIALALNGVAYILSRRPDDLVYLDGFDDLQVYEELSEDYLPDTIGHPWIGTPEDAELVGEIAENWI